MTARVQLQKKVSGREPQGAWCQDNLIGCKLTQTQESDPACESTVR
jgi:hypothetical protein